MRRGLVVALAATLLVAACSGAASDRDTGPRSGEIAIDLDRVVGSFDRRLLGTNVPAWVGPQRLADPEFQQLAVASGATTIRMPGGSWSTSYDWLGCENGDGERCHWTWAARPSDFVGFLAATGIEGMWTVSFNGTAQEAAALVAFFNGEVGDERLIGTDRRGRDWGTVGQWAQLRAAHGHPDPQPVRMWEVGNEVYAAKRDTAGADCVAFGWEDVWTCDGEAYVHGDATHDGFVDFRTAMQAVDPTIAVGAVGVSGPKEWGDFGTEVIEGTAGRLDFYVVHHYPFDGDVDAERILEEPQRSWPRLIDAVTPALQDASDSPAAVAITEYNLISFLDGDTDAKLNQAVNALYIADGIGQMAMSGVAIANQWNFANGRGPTGADYGMVDGDSHARAPQYYGLAMWAGVGRDLLAVTSGFDASTTLSAYASAGIDGTITVLAVNKTGATIDARLRLDGAAGSYQATANVASASALDATSMAYNGVAEPPTDLGAVAAISVGETTGSFSYSFEPFSITAVRLTPSA